MDARSIIFKAGGLRKEAFAIEAKATLVLNTSAVAGAAGVWCRGPD
jgi:hypothetical protein